MEVDDDKAVYTFNESEDGATVVDAQHEEVVHVGNVVGNHGQHSKDHDDNRNGGILSFKGGGCIIHQDDTTIYSTNVEEELFLTYVLDCKVHNEVDTLFHIIGQANQGSDIVHVTMHLMQMVKNYEITYIKDEAIICLSGSTSK